MNFYRSTICLACLAFFACENSVRAQAWREAFDPLHVYEFSLEMDPGDWAAVQNDTTFDLERPAMFHAAGEDPLFVAVRRKSSVSLDGKVSLKIDVNQYVAGQKWHGL